jgi:hypothetical protein
MDNRPVDLSVLDPSRDARRWAALLESVASRAWAARKRQLTILAQLVHWARPALAIAATIALFCWMGSRGETTTTQLEPADQLSAWAAQDTRPPTSAIIAVLGEDGDAGH